MWKSVERTAGSRDDGGPGGGVAGFEAVGEDGGHDLAVVDADGEVRRGVAGEPEAGRLGRRGGGLAPEDAPPRAAEQHREDRLGDEAGAVGSGVLDQREDAAVGPRTGGDAGGDR